MLRGDARLYGGVGRTAAPHWNAACPAMTVRDVRPQPVSRGRWQEIVKKRRDARIGGAAR